MMTHHVLVVDDDPGIRATVSEILDLEGCEVVAACNGLEALEQIQTSPPCVILLDMRMPVLDGWGVARELRARGVGVPIVVMTAAQDAALWAREIQADAVLAKPFDLNELLAVVARFADCSQG
jgi:CheY-like chemotaxis protein